MKGTVLNERTEPIELCNSSSSSSAIVFGRMAKRFVLPGMAKSLAVGSLGAGGGGGAPDFEDTELERSRFIMKAPSLLLRECPLRDAMLLAGEEEDEGEEAAVRGEDMPTLLNDGNALIDGMLDGCSGGSAWGRACSTPPNQGGQERELGTDSNMKEEGLHIRKAFGGDDGDNEIRKTKTHLLRHCRIRM
jgi:hypothetical protein